MRQGHPYQSSGLVKVLSSLALMYRHQRLASVQYHSAKLKREQKLVMKGQVERTGQLMTKAEKENILLAEELHLKMEELKVIPKTYHEERAQTLQLNRFLQEQLNLAKTKYDEVHAKLDTVHCESIRPP